MKPSAFRIIALLLFPLLPFSLSAAIFTVTSNVNGTTVDGVSLRWAITQANATAGTDYIHFNIPGMAPHVIDLTTALPNSTQKLYIDGTTQPPNGFAGSGQKIIVDGSLGGITTFQGSNDMDLRVYGVWMRNFSSYALFTNGTYDTLIVRECRFSNCGTGMFCNGSYHYLEMRRSIAEGSTSYGFGSNGTYNYLLAIDNRFVNNIGDGMFSNGVGWTMYSRGNRITGNGGNGIGGNGAGNIFSNRDWIAANGNDGIGTNGFDYIVVVDSSIVGLDSLGTTAMANLGDGIFHNGFTVNFTVTHSTVSANGGCGLCNNGSIDTATVQNSRFGTDITGTLDRGNTYQGIRLSGPALIGGIGIGNVISGNGMDGISNYNATGSSIIRGNFIGTDASGTIALANGSDGIELSGDSTIVGGVLAGEANTIAFNVAEGIVVSGPNNPLRRNRIYCNGADGIELNGSGNTNYPAPVITGITAGSVTGMANPFDEIEIFANHSCGCSIQGQGAAYIATVTANAAGNWAYIGALPGNVTTTATSAAWNTSEFNSCAIVLDAGIPFFAEAEGEAAAQLWWEVPAGMEVTGLDIERSLDGEQFSVLAPNADPHGLSRYRDASVPTAFVWYRLRYWDAAGVENYSEVREVRFPWERAQVFSVWPNPAKDEVFVMVPAPAAAGDFVPSIALVDAVGHSIPLWEGAVGNGQPVRLALPDVPEGVYLLRAQHGADVWTRRILVRR